MICPAEALENAQKALELDETLYFSEETAAMASALLGDRELSEEYYQRCVQHRQNPKKLREIYLITTYIAGTMFIYEISVFDEVESGGVWRLNVSRITIMTNTPYPSWTNPEKSWDMFRVRITLLLQD